MNKILDILKKLWILIQGKKTTIGTILGALITFALAKGYIDAIAAQLLATILVALGLSANIANHISKK